MRSIGLLLFPIIILTSCAGSKSYVTFEVLEPAGISYPENTSKVGLVNRAPYTSDYFYDLSDKVDHAALRILDTMIINNLAKGFEDGKENELLTYLDDIVYLDSRRRDTTGIKDAASQQYIERLYSRHDLDAIIFLEYYLIDVDKSPPFYSYSQTDFIEEYRLFLDVMWRVFAKGNEKPIDVYRARDTLYYVNESRKPSSTYVNASSVIKYGCYEIGLQYGLRQIPIWNGVSRVIFRGGDEALRKAAEFTDKGQWEKAYDLWNGLLRDNNSKVAAKATHNIAVYYELEDNVKLASEYIERAFQLWSNEYIESYKQELDIRVKNKADILKQIH